MRLGVVMTGVGVQATANVGVLRALEERGIELHSVCGLQAGAWPAALYAVGKKSDRMLEDIRAAAAAGKRLLAPTASARGLLRGGNALCDGKRIERLLLMQAGQRVLSLCERPAAFPCRLARNGQRIAFVTRPLNPDAGLTLVMQATVSFAARAAMALPPFLSPLAYMGSPLLGEADAALCCRLLAQLGAQRVLIVCVHASPKKKPGALDLAGAVLTGGIQAAAKEAYAGLFNIVLPDSIGAEDVNKAEECEAAGYLAAQEQLDALLSQMGMARCRVLPFERRVTGQRR